MGMTVTSVTEARAMRMNARRMSESLILVGESLPSLMIDDQDTTIRGRTTINTNQIVSPCTDVTGNLKPGEPVFFLFFFLVMQASIGVLFLLNP